jgi:hypothetical protein
MKIKFQFRSILFLILLAGSLIIGSCNKVNDHYSDGDFMVFFGIVEKTAAIGDNNNVIRLDNGDRFVSLQTQPGLTELKAGQRVLVNFAPVDDKVNNDNSKTYFGNINLIQNILFKNIQRLSSTSVDSFGHDPIIIRDSWVSGDSILTVKFNYYTAGKIHYNNLIYNKEGNGIDNPYIFEFRHNANRDQKNYLTAGYISFNLVPFRITGQHKIDFHIRYTDLDGKKVDLPHSMNY